MSLAGKLALITGCTYVSHEISKNLDKTRLTFGCVCFTNRGGIGQATAKALALQGCSIAVNHRSEASKRKAEELIAQITTDDGPSCVRAMAFQADLSSYENAKTLYDEVVARMGHPDIFFGNHGATVKTVGATGNIEDISPEIFEETWRTNTGTTFYVRCGD